MACKASHLIVHHNIPRLMITSGTGGEIKNDAHSELEFVELQA
jgi:hypothetical protein